MEACRARNGAYGEGKVLIDSNSFTLVSKHSILDWNIASVEYTHSNFDERWKVQFEIFFFDDLTDLKSEYTQLWVLNVIQVVVSSTEWSKSC